jgi:hypothetical protein
MRSRATKSPSAWTGCTQTCVAPAVKCSRSTPKLSREAGTRSFHRHGDPTTAGLCGFTHMGTVAGSRLSAADFATQDGRGPNVFNEMIDVFLGGDDRGNTDQYERATRRQFDRSEC